MRSDKLPLEIRTPFCARPEGRLHVEPGDEGVLGEGYWAELDGIVLSRQCVGGRMYCDFCAAESRAA